MGWETGSSWANEKIITIVEKREGKKLMSREGILEIGFFTIPFYKHGNIAIKIMIFPCLRICGVLKFLFDLAVLECYL
ncbi:MAG: hypothetical protein KIS65_03705 [Nitrosomonas sp.]|nr:hypothetical protein [Nitrosomonas sp.]